MSNNNNKKCVPELRFPGFTGEWVEMKLGEVCECFSGGTPKSGEPKYYGGDIPFIRSGEIHSNHTALFLTKEGLENSAAKLVRKGDLLYALYGATSGEVDLSKINGAINQAILCIRSNRLNLCFLSNYLNRRKNSIISRFLQGGQGNLSSEIIMSFPIFLPPTLAEQQKIAECLSSLDDEISAETEQVEALKEHKKGMMQQLFPSMRNEELGIRNGKCVPKLRFPGFEGEWVEKKLGEVAVKINKRNKKHAITRVLTNSATEGVIDQSDYFDRNIAVRNNTDNYLIIELDEFVYNPRISVSAPVGPISRNKVGQGIMSPLYTVFKFNDCDVQFMEHYFGTTIWHPYLKSIANFGARHDRMNITTEAFFDMPILLPTVAEQEKIAECLSSIDEQIAAQQQKVEALKNHKKGLMQKLFPQVIK